MSQFAKQTVMPIKPRLTVRNDALQRSTSFYLGGGLTARDRSQDQAWQARRNLKVCCHTGCLLSYPLDLRFTSAHTCEYPYPPVLLRLSDRFAAPNVCEIFVPYRKSKTSFEVYREGGTLSSIRMLIKMVLVVRAFRNKMDEELRKIGQGSARMETLGAIVNMPGQKSQSDVAKRLRVENATITRMVDILSNEGLVRRTPDPADRRVNLLSVSSEGEEVLRDIFVVYDALREHILTDLPEEEYDRLHDIFDKMLKRLDEPIDKSVKIDDLPSHDRLKH